MKFDKFTLKAQEAIEDASEIAVEQSNQYILPAHLFKSLLKPDDGFIRLMLQNSSINITQIENDVKELVDKIPSVSGIDDHYLSKELEKVSFRPVGKGASV